MSAFEMSAQLMALAACCCLLFMPAAAAAGSGRPATGLLSTLVGSPGQQGYQLEDEPTCVNTFLACQAACSDLKLRAEQHRPVLTDEKVVSTAVYAVVAALAATTAWALAHAQRSQQTLRRREADLQLQLQGVKEQAWDLGRRAARGSRPASRASRPSSRADRVFSPPPPSGAGPVGGTQWPGASPSSAYSGSSLNQQGAGLPLPIAPTAVTSPPGSYAPPHAAPSANGISMLVSEASLRLDTQGADQLHAAPTSAAAKDSPAKSPHSAAVSQQQQQSWGGPPAAQNSYSPSAGYQLPGLSPYSSASGGLPPTAASPGYLHTPAASAGHGGFTTPPPTGGSAAGVEQGGVAQDAQLASPADHAWVNTSRGGGTPAVFSSEASGMSPGFSPMLQQQQARSPFSGGGGSALQHQHQQQPEPVTPASGSTTLSAGTNVHSIAGSCGGSVGQHYNSRTGGGLSPPSSVTSAASGRSARNIASAPQVLNMMDTLEAMVHSAAAKKKAAQLKERETLRMHGSPRGSPRAPGSSMSGGAAAAAGGAGRSPGASGMSPAHSASRLSLV